MGEQMQAWQDAPLLQADRLATERLCAVCRKVLPVSRLMRFVRSPDGHLVPDLRRRLPGRGVWITATRSVLEEAARGRVFTKALKNSIVIPPDLPDQIDRLLEQRALESLSLAKKAGVLVSGFAAVSEAIETGWAGVLVQASDGAPDGFRKLAAAALRCYRTDQAPIIVTIFRSSQLDLALGLTHVIHAALGAGASVQTVLDRIAALAFWRDGGQPLKEAEPHMPSSDGG